MRKYRIETDIDDVGQPVWFWTLRNSCMALLARGDEYYTRQAAQASLGRYMTAKD